MMVKVDPPCKLNRTAATTMQIEVSYFAILREQAGVSAESVKTDAADAAGLYDALRERHGFTLGVEHLRVAINDAFAPWQQALRDGDRVVFIPPVAGG